MEALYNFATDSQWKLEAVANVTGEYVEQGKSCTACDEIVIK